MIMRLHSFSQMEGQGLALTTASGTHCSPEREGLSRRRPGHDVAAQVRLLALLVLTVATYLYGRAKERLTQELEG